MESYNLVFLYKLLNKFNKHSLLKLLCHFHFPSCSLVTCGGGLLSFCDLSVIHLSNKKILRYCFNFPVSFNFFNVLNYTYY